MINVDLEFNLQGKLPKDHEIWLVNKEINSNGEVNYFPQCDNASAYFNSESGKWSAKTFITKNSTAEVFAVITPPTSQAFFRYYCQVGRKFNNNFTPLKSFPPECIVRSDGIRLEGK